MPVEEDAEETLGQANMMAQARKKTKTKSKYQQTFITTIKFERVEMEKP